MTNQMNTEGASEYHVPSFEEILSPPPVVKPNHKRKVTQDRDAWKYAIALSFLGMGVLLILSHWLYGAAGISWGILVAVVYTGVFGVFACLDRVNVASTGLVFGSSFLLFCLIQYNEVSIMWLFVAFLISMVFGSVVLYPINKDKKND